MKFPKDLFLGSGVHSMAHCYHLHQRLDEAFEILSCLQQPPSMHHEIPDNHEEEKDDWEASVNSIAKEIYRALTGKNPNAYK